MTILWRGEPIEGGAHRSMGVKPWEKPALNDIPGLKSRKDCDMLETHGLLGFFLSAQVIVKYICDHDKLFHMLSLGRVNGGPGPLSAIT